MLQSVVTSSAAKPSSPVEAGQAQPAFDTTLLFEMLVSDLQWSSLHIGTIGCLLNAGRREGTTISLAPWRHVLHDDGPAVQLGLRFCRDMGLTTDVEKKLHALCEELSTVTRATARLVAFGRSPGASHRLQLSSMSEAWQGLAQKAIDALTSLRNDVRDRLDSRYSQSSDILVGFLKEVVAGSAHRVNAQGEITLPDLPQRRRRPRADIRIPCRILTHDGAVRAIILDISRSGFGVECEARLQPRQLVTVELQDRRRLPANVVWQRASRIGLRLAALLPIDDPLLAKTGGRPG